ncbi:MAG: ABC transporter ATP-binding protein, partial [Acidobacteriota bacterium]
VVASTLVMEGGGRVGEYAGGFSDWLRQRPDASSPAPGVAKKKPASPAPKAVAGPSAPKPRKLSYNEKRDLEALPARIEALEDEQGALHGELADPEIYRRDGGAAVAAARTRLEAVDAELEAAYERWSELEEIASG